MEGPPQTWVHASLEKALLSAPGGEVQGVQPPAAVSTNTPNVGSPGTRGHHSYTSFQGPQGQRHIVLTSKQKRWRGSARECRAGEEGECGGDSAVLRPQEACGDLTPAHSHPSHPTHSTPAWPLCCPCHPLDTYVL